MRRAFVMGSKGPNGSSQLKYALEDVERISNSLTDSRCGFEVENPNPDSSISSVCQQLADATDSCTKDDTFVCYFSGHGHLKKGSLFLLWDNSDIKKLSSTAISVTRIMENISHCEANNKLLILDCCHAGAVVNMPKSGDEAATNEIVIRPDNYLILLASTRLEKTREFEELQGSFLTVNICDAIGEKLKEADLDDDGSISFNDLKKWLEQRYKEYNKKISEQEHVPLPYFYGQYKGDFFLTLPPTEFGKSSPEIEKLRPEPVKSSLSSQGKSGETSLDIYSNLAPKHLINIANATKTLLESEQKSEIVPNFVYEISDKNRDKIRKEIRESCNKIYKELNLDKTIKQLLDDTVFAAYILLYLKEISSQQEIPVSVAVIDPQTRQYKIDQAVGRRVSTNEVETNLNYSEMHDSYFGQWLLQDPALLTEGFCPIGIVTELHEEETEFKALDRELEFNNTTGKPLVYVLKIPGKCKEQEILDCRQLPLSDSIGYNVVEGESQKGQAYRRALINLSKNIGEKNNERPGYFGQQLEIGEILFLPIRYNDNLKLNFLIMPRKKKIPRDLASMLLFKRCADLLYVKLSEYLNHNYQLSKDK